MTGPRVLRVASFAAALVLTGCAGDAVATPATTANYLQEYANAGSALDTATTTWDALGQALVAANTNTVANEAPIDATYARALQAFSTALLTIQFPASATNGVVESSGQRRERCPHRPRRRRKRRCIDSEVRQRRIQPPGGDQRCAAGAGAGLQHANRRRVISDDYAIAAAATRSTSRRARAALRRPTPRSAG